MNRFNWNVQGVEPASPGTSARALQVALNTLEDEDFVVDKIVGEPDKGFIVIGKKPRQPRTPRTGLPEAP